MPSILSTKKLKANQRELFLNSGLGLVEYNAIKIDILDFTFEESKIENAIFSSKNAVNAVSKKSIEIKNAFCVGEKTAKLAEENGWQVLEISENAKNLGRIISENYTDQNFIFFCGSKRRGELPELLKNHLVNFREIEVYQTSLNFQKFKSEFDGIMFFSPSGVQSFVSQNKSKATAFCIGNTTASEAKKYFEEVIMASKTSIESVIARTINHYRN